ncbi:MAG: LPS assembly lipoprotein LptE [Bdellovibrionaceae bacterium]|nr:LPS assembly lipoprotein LptE [Pseudobdellovibrionaceae bacterium]
MRTVLLFTTLIAMGGCAYQIGTGNRSLPGGARTLSIPVFKNSSMEPGAEVIFTEALRKEFARSGVARLVSDEQSELRLLGRVRSIQFQPGAKKQAEDSGSLLPDGTVLAAEYRIVVEVEIEALRRVDGAKVWSGTFRGERTYVAPQVQGAGINTVNPLYNISARRMNLETIANDLVVEAHSRITENF